MAYAMTKRGSLDNAIVYEFVCDTIADMNKIENKYRTIGSIAIVLQGQSESLEVYICSSGKEWAALNAGSTTEVEGTGLTIYICGEEEIDSQTGLPDVEEPDGSTIYLVAASEESGNLYDEYIYVNENWEKFGSGHIDLSNYATKADTVLTTTLSRGRAANSTVGTGSLAFGNNVTASKQFAHAEGNNTQANGYGSHAEGNYTEVNGQYSHVEGVGSVVNCGHAHGEGTYTITNGANSHVSGRYNVADNNNNWPLWVAGNSYTAGQKVRKQDTVNGETVYIAYECLVDNSDDTVASNKWRALSQELNYAEIVGNGSGVDSRSNARVLDWEGNEHLMGDLYIGCNADSSGGTAVGARIAALEAEIASLRAALFNLVNPTSMTLENGEPITDESGNTIEFDT